MAVIPYTIDIVVADMGEALAFYRELGLDALPTRWTRCRSGSRRRAGRRSDWSSDAGLVVGHRTGRRTMVRTTNPHWVDPVGRRVTFSSKCDSPAEVDAGKGCEGGQNVAAVARPGPKDRIALAPEDIRGLLQSDLARAGPPRRFA